MGDMKLGKGKYTLDDDQALSTDTDAKFYGMSASYPSFNNEGKDLIVQYSVKYDKGVYNTIRALMLR